MQASDIRGGSRVDIALGATPFSVSSAGSRAIDVIAPDRSVGFDIGQITRGQFASRIETARVSQTDEGTRLRLLLNCECSYATLVTNGTLSIEIRDPGPGDAQTDLTEEIVQRTDAASRRFRSAFAPGRAPAPRARQTAIADLGLQTGAEGDTNGASPVAQIGTPFGEQDRDGTRGARAEEIRLARLRLVEQLAKAAEQGLLDFATAESAELFAQTTPTEFPPDEINEEPVDQPIAEAAPRPPARKTLVVEPDPERLVPGDETLLVELPLRARTARDRVFRRDRLETLIPSHECIDDHQFTLLRLDNDRGFADLVTDHGGQLISRFDEPDPAAVEKLARLYLSFGFGVEARQLLDTLGDNVENRALLSDIAMIIENETPSVTGPIARNGHCSALALLWFTLAGFQMENGSIERLTAAGRQLISREERNREILAQFVDQTPVLRRLLGPKLMGRGLDAGDIELAESVDKIMRRMVDANSPKLELARARLLAEGGNVASAEAVYKRLALMSVPEAQKALLLLLESQVDRGAAPSVALADALSDAALIARGSPFERRLKVAEIRARAIAEGLQSALDQVDRAIRRNPANRALLVDSAHAVFEDAVADPEQPLLFARAVLDQSDLISPAADGDLARSRVAEQLIAIGLANAALDILTPAAGRKTASLRQVAATAHVALGDGASALSALDGIESPRASSLRTAAYLLVDQPNDALAAAAQDTELASEARAKLALLAGDWRGASEAGSTADRLLAAYMAEAGDAQQSGETSGPSAGAGARLVSELERDAPVPTSAMLRPPSVGDALTLNDAQAVMDASQTVRDLVKEMLEDG
ncbi:MAG: hypothetical protein AAF367_15540 [Pseudomonadota bacterium]